LYGDAYAWIELIHDFHPFDPEKYL
jgi:hypothetical protein